jgi:hypothetical protein
MFDQAADFNRVHLEEGAIEDSVPMAMDVRRGPP